ncbi:D-aminoacylase [Candidatus Sumerlaeota bacterium]|nr:D-aminoacylase [Candidatus Sumerlaeota bacterium]
MPFDLIIRNGTVVDGTGAEPRRADVAIEGGRIAAVETLPEDAEARQTLDASGCHVAPGFIDVHTHSDYTVLACPTCDSKVHQGVTTEIMGNCGFSPFPLKGQMLERERQEIEDLGLTPNWDDLPSYRAKLQERGHSMNVGTLVGNGNLRGSTCGVGNVPKSPEVIAAQVRELEAAMDAGAMGLSSGLIYAPSHWADTEELVEIAKVLKRRNGLYTSHIRGEGDRLLDAVDEACTIGERAEIPVQVSHLKACAPRNWGKVERALERITASDSPSRWVRFDKYPYTASGTSFGSLLPDWVVDGTRDEIVARLRDRSRTDEILASVEERMEAEGKWVGTLISDAACEEFKALEGKCVAEAAEMTGLTPGEFFLQLLIASRGNASMVCFTQDQGETDRVLEHAWGMVGSDAAVRSPEGPTGQGKPHPRGYGSFARYLRRYVRERETLSIAEAVRKITSLPAEMFGLRGRGVLRPGAVADVTVFDLAQVNDPATFADPHRLAEGFRHVVVGGTPVILAGRHTGATPGVFVERE